MGKQRQHHNGNLDQPGQRRFPSFAIRNVSSLAHSLTHFLAS